MTRSLRVLVADDSPLTRRILVDALVENWHCDVDEAHGGALALKLAKQNRYDLIISDVQMPEMGGVELFWALHEADILDWRVSGPDFCFLTGVPQDDLARRIGDDVFEAEFVSYLSASGLRWEAIAALIERVFARSASEVADGLDRFDAHVAGAAQEDQQLILAVAVEILRARRDRLAAWENRSGADFGRFMHVLAGECGHFASAPYATARKIESDAKDGRPVDQQEVDLLMTQLDTVIGDLDRRRHDLD